MRCCYANGEALIKLLPAGGLGLCQTQICQRICEFIAKKNVFLHSLLLSEKLLCLRLCGGDAVTGVVTMDTDAFSIVWPFTAGRVVQSFYNHELSRYNWTLCRTVHQSFSQSINM